MTENMRRFAAEYRRDFDGVRAYRAAYPGVKSDRAAAAGAVRLLGSEEVQALIHAPEPPEHAPEPERARGSGGVTPGEVLCGLREIAFPMDPESVSVRERLRALEILGRYLGLFVPGGRGGEAKQEKVLTVRFEGTGESEM